MILRPLFKDDESELRRIHATPEVSFWWDQPEEGFPWTDEPESTRLTIEVEGTVAGLIQFGRSRVPNTAMPRSTCSSIRRSIVVAWAQKP